MDFFNPAAQAAFWSELNNGIFDDGMDAWWMDASEPEFDVLKDKTDFSGKRRIRPQRLSTVCHQGYL